MTKHWHNSNTSMRQRLKLWLGQWAGRWLMQGLTPRQLAVTLALGFAIGCVPLVGATTALCTLVAAVFGLNMAAIQAANWLAMPLQVALLVPFLKLGQWMFGGPQLTLNRAELMTRLTSSPWHATAQVGGLFGRALLAWLLTAGPVAMVLMAVLTVVLSRMQVSANNRAKAADRVS